MRFCHTLRKNHSSETIHSLCCVDCESYLVKVTPQKSEHHLRFGIAWFGVRYTSGEWGAGEWFTFHTPREFWQWLYSKMRPKTKTYLFAHNTSFDFPLLDIFNECHRIFGKPKLAVIEAPPTIIRYSKDKRTLICLDSLNIWRESLKRVGEILHIEKMDMPGFGDADEIWERYCKNDVEILRQAVMKWANFILKRDFGGFATTVPAQAMRLYRHRFMTHDVVIDTHEPSLKLSRESYHGARTECFRLGKLRGGWTCLDVNSMYPYVMREYEYPRALQGYTKCVNVGGLQRLLQDYACVARVQLSTEENAYPLYDGKKLVFPVGEFETCLTSPELCYALEHNHVKGVLEVATYHRAKLFTEFVDVLYKMRLEADASSDPTDSTLIKKLMNGFYGKWGQNGRKYTNYGETTDLSCKSYRIIKYETGEIMQYRQLGGLVQIFKDEGESSESFPAIASHITAYARLHLYKIIQEAGYENVSYCDTDSIFVRSCATARLRSVTSATRIGYLKVEKTARNIEIRGPKDYTFGDKTRIKGVTSKAKRVSINEYEQERWSQFVGLANSDHFAHPTTETITKHLRRQYDKGEVDKAGRVHPRRLHLDAQPDS